MTGWNFAGGVTVRLNANVYVRGWGVGGWGVASSSCWHSAKSLFTRRFSRSLVTTCEISKASSSCMPSVMTCSFDWTQTEQHLWSTNHYQYCTKDKAPQLHPTMSNQPCLERVPVPLNDRATAHPTPVFCRPIRWHFPPEYSSCFPRFSSREWRYSGWGLV